MSYITDIFERLDLQQIREFLLHGVECVEVSDKSYKQRLDSAGDIAFKSIHKKFPEEADHIEVKNDMHHYAGAMQDVYMEIGIVCGARLMAELLNKKE